MTFTVGQLALATDTKAVTIRFYEKLELLPAASRSASGYRLYTAAERDRLLFIRRCRALGFSLDDVRQLLEFSGQRSAPCTGVDIKVTEQLKQVQQRIRDLQGLEQELVNLITCCKGGVIKDCRIIESLSRKVDQ